ncbi:MAG: dTDP-4-dehydrorhamnose reductase [Phycisphaerae bacterium]
MSSARRVLVLGARGQLGRRVVDALHAAGGWEPIATDREELDITDTAAVRAAFAEHCPAWVVNCAGFTNVDACETDRGTDVLNADAVATVAAAADAHGARLLHISTDYVFDGEPPPGVTTCRPYREEDPTNPLNAYGRAKLASEGHARACKHWLIVRTAWLFGPDGRHFIATILAAARTGKPLRVVHDQVGSPSYAPDVASCLERLMRLDAQGVFHVVNSGQASWYEVACTALRLAGMGGVPVAPIASSEYASPARRPAYSVLDAARFIAATGRTPRVWTEAAAAHLRSA